MKRNEHSVSALPGKLSVSLGREDSENPGLADEVVDRIVELNRGSLIVNADDWGRDREVTDRTLACVLRGTVSSVSAMVFMADSQRASEIAREASIDAGLHLNFTTAFTAPECPATLVEHQAKISACLRKNAFAQAFYHPRLAQSFQYVVRAQLDEYRRLHDREPVRLDGHHHMHLCSNVLLGRLLPAGSLVRRNFSFQPGEKSLLNRLYRRWIDRQLARRHRLTDFFFSLPPLQPRSRLERIFSLARQFVVEVETHPINPEEHQFLAEGEILRWVGEGGIAPRYVVRPIGNSQR